MSENDFLIFLKNYFFYLIIFFKQYICGIVFLHFISCTNTVLFYSIFVVSAATSGQTQVPAQRLFQHVQALAAPQLLCGSDGASGMENEFRVSECEWA